MPLFGHFEYYHISSLLSRKLLIQFKMMITLILAVTILSVLTLASQTPILGKISLKPLSKDGPSEVIEFHPLSQEPKIANLKNNEVELIFMSDQDSCKQIPQTLTLGPAVIAVIDTSHTQFMCCGLSIKKNRLKQAGYKGFLVANNDSKYLEKSYCHMLDDSKFLMGYFNTTTYYLIDKYYKVGSQPEPNFQIKGLLSVELLNSTLKLLEVWTSSLNDKTYETIQTLSHSMGKLTTLQGHVKWTPRIVSYDCVHGQSEKICNNSLQVASCGCKGFFCSPETRQKSPVPLIKEDIRQLLIFRQHYSKYFSYMSAFRQRCLEIYQREKYADECATTVMNSLQIDSFSINEVIDSFLDQCSDWTKIKANDIFQTLQRDQRAFNSYGRYPLVLINKQTIDYKTEDELNGILCSKLQLNDEGCFTIVEQTTVVTSSVSIVFFVLLVVSLVLVGAAVVYCYRKKLKRDMNKQIKMQVSTAVQHYFALTETSNSAK